MEQRTGALVKRDGLGAEMATVTETTTAAVAAQARANVEARWLIAQRCPRNIDQVRDDLMRDCKRPSFAEVAMYLKPIGDGIEGPSIRFVEAALQAMGNIVTETAVIYDDDRKRIIQVSVTDLERNVTHPKQITVTKTIERSFVRDGVTVLSRRTNSYGKPVYIVEATDDEMNNKEAALASKALRTCGLRLIPGWLVDECMEMVRAVKRDAAAKDPEEQQRRMCDAFSAIGVTPAALSDYLGHQSSRITPDEIAELRSVYEAIRAGETTWSAVMDARREERGDAPETAPASGAKKAVADAVTRRTRGGKDDEQ